MNDILSDLGVRSVLIKSIRHYFHSHEDYINIFCDIIHGNEINNHVVSLNFIDWFVKVYCKNNEPEIHTSYIIKLEKYKKKFFDPISRKSESDPIFSFEYKENYCIYTTIKQLNFFVWFFRENIYTIMIDNFEQLSNIYYKK